MKNIFVRVAVTAGVAGAALMMSTQESSAINLAHEIGGTSGGFATPGALNATYSCSHQIYGENGTYMSGTDGTVQANVYTHNRSTYTSACAAGNTSTTASSVVTSSTTLKAATVQTLNIISARISQVQTADSKLRNDPVSLAFDPEGKAAAIGLSAGDSRKGIGAWVRGAFTWLEDENAATQWDGNIYSVMGGVDYLIKDRFLIGVSGGYESTDLNTDFNNGNLEANGFLVAPYASFRFNKMFSFDATGGYAWLNYDVDRKETATTGATFTGEFDSERWFAAARLNADHTLRDRIQLHGHFGYSHTSEDQDAYTETSTGGDTSSIAGQTIELGQALLGARVGYSFNKVTPFVSAQGEWDLSKDDVAVAANQTTPEDSDFGLRLGAGLDFRLSPNFSGSLKGETVLLRDEYTEHKAMAKVRVDF